MNTTNCPNCQGLVEIPDERLDNLLDCPGCQTAFELPRHQHPLPPMMPPATGPAHATRTQRQPRRECDALRAKGEVWAMVAGLTALGSLVIGALTLCAMLAGVASGDAGEIFIGIAASLLSLAFAGYLIAQVIHIRANTSER